LAVVAAAAADGRRWLGGEGVVQLDAVTGAPRTIERLDGFLSAPSGAPAAAIARGYLAGHVALFGASAADVSGLVQTRDYVDIGGTHHLSFAQEPDAIPRVHGRDRVRVADRGQALERPCAPRRRPRGPGRAPHAGGDGGARAPAGRRRRLDGPAARVDRRGARSRDALRGQRPRRRVPRLV